jgi:hypothetical protein
MLPQRAEPDGRLLPLALPVEREVDVVELLSELREGRPAVVIECGRRQVAQDADHAQDALDCDGEGSFVGYQERQGGVAWRWPEQALAGCASASTAAVPTGEGRRPARRSPLGHALGHGGEKRGSTRLSTAPVTKKNGPNLQGLSHMARPGLEPGTPRFSVVCSTS